MLSWAPREDGSVPEDDQQIVGSEGRGYEYIGEEDEDDEDVRSESSGLSTPFSLTCNELKS